MPIIIENISGISFDDLPQKYRVLVNAEEICRFEHTRRDGLAECLRKASEAVRTKEP